MIPLIALHLHKNNAFFGQQVMCCITELQNANLVAGMNC
jgi:hypothetical protein